MVMRVPLSASGHPLERVELIVSRMMKCNPYLGRLEAKCGASWMEDEVDGDEADVVNKILVDDRTVVISRLKALNVGGNV
jgi:hypothetical protein